MTSTTTLAGRGTGSAHTDRTEEEERRLLTAAVRSLLRQPVPLPGSGGTAERWDRLRAAAADDVVVARLVEAHLDADAILAELGQERPRRGEWWGVWAAEPPSPRVTATPEGDRWLLSGAKAWCSGTGLCTHALLTADTDDGVALFAVDLRGDDVRGEPSTWRAAGMRRSSTGTVHLDRVTARRVGSHADYLDRPGFWHGGAGVAACWVGGAERVARTLRQAVERRPEAHALAHLGAVDAALAGARWVLDAAARELDEAPTSRRAAQVRTMRVRAVAEQAVTTTVDHVGRALGATPLCLDGDHAAAVADVTVYVRQSHAERDLEGLGRLLVGELPQ
ncbi:hypothetical protein [Lapillicoccus jejuensis]|uniref:Alkylation response protein AidB-like acyl-CoA dehydrogenase n=1 Tax=Lapillicoccus jejuensis TaxID=402171 RepID=A0A542DXK4_9MICO|nr:hypothetical protein [Lapillicoccus jejuensis]TQJ07823.1 hypothetical protein FB458_0892 [Lapillicoccus jejuensis]